MRVRASLLVAVLVGILGIAVLPQESTPGFFAQSSLDQVSSCTTPSGMVREDDETAPVDCVTRDERRLDRWEAALVVVTGALVGLAVVRPGRGRVADLTVARRGRAFGRVSPLRGPPLVV